MGRLVGVGREHARETDAHGGDARRRGDSAGARLGERARVSRLVGDLA